MKRTFGWVLIVSVSFAIGAGLGLGISWGILPVKNKGATPAVLSYANKDIYRLFIADSFNVTQDLTRAQIRLELLDGGTAASALEDQAQRLLQEQGNDEARNKLQALHDTLTNGQGISKPILLTAVTATSVATPETIKTLTLGNGQLIPAEKSPTVMTTQSVRQVIFNIRNRTQVCDSLLPAPLLQVMVFESSGKPASGIAFIISSKESSERILTGLKPEKGAGYVDFILTPGILYSFIVEGANGNPETVSDSVCTSSDGRTYPGGWLFEIQL